MRFTKEWSTVQQVRELEDGKTAGLQTVLASMDSQLTALSIPAPADITYKGPRPSVDVLMLAVILSRGKDFVTGFALELVEVGMGVGHVPAHVVLRGIDVGAVRYLAAKASVLHSIVY